MPRPRRGCRIPYSRLERITPAQARSRVSTPGGLTGTLIEGAVRFEQVDLVKHRDFRIEARGRTSSLLSSVGGGRGRFDFSHITLSGLERDAAGKPLIAWDVDRLASVRESSLRYAELSWANDCVWLEEGGVLFDSWLHSHTDFINAQGVRQHPDSVQIVRGGFQVVAKSLLDGSQPAVPLTAAGEPIEIVTNLSRTGQTLMVNNEGAGITGPITFTGNTLRDGAACHVNLTPGAKVDGYEWWQRRYDEAGAPTHGLFFTGNTIEVKSKYDPLRGPRELVERIIADPTNRMVLPDGTFGPWTSTKILTWASENLREEPQSPTSKSSSQPAPSA